MDFIVRFFEDRRLVCSTTRRFLEKDHKLSRLLENANPALQLELGTHLMGISTIEEHFVLDAIIRAARPQRIIEIGIFRGHTALTLTRAMSQVCLEGRYIGVDIDTTSAAIANNILSAQGLASATKFVFGQSKDLVPGLPNPDLAFIDGSHTFDAVAHDFVGIYNKLGKGGLIIMHDIGCHAWGYHRDPGWLFYRVLPDLLQEKACRSSLDSMCRELTMRLLSPQGYNGYRYCESQQEGLEIARLTSPDIINGAGGLGLILKLDAKHQLDIEAVLSQKPDDKEVTDYGKPQDISVFGRAARKLANFIP